MAQIKDFVVKNGLVVLGSSSTQSISTDTGALVVNGGAEEGIQGWKALVNRCEPKVKSRSAGQLLQILGLDFGDDVIAKLQA
jgi:hypothetical protein